MRQHEPKLSSIEEEVAIETLRRHQDEICKDCESLLFAPVLNSKGLQVDAKGEEEPERVLEIRARYCCEPPPEHSATAAPSVARRRRPRSAPRTPRPNEPNDALEYRLQRSPYQDASGLQDLFTENDLSETSRRTPSFFEPKLPKGVASQRKLHHMMDVLREDDRRRMEEMTNRIHVCRARAALAKAQLAAPSAAASQAQKLAWMLQGWSSAEAKLENRPRRRNRAA